MQDCRDWVSHELIAYHGTRRKLQLLQYEMEHPARVTEEEMIISMAVSSNHQQSFSEALSTAHVALHHRENMMKTNQETISEIENEYKQISGALNRLEFYVSLLDEKYAAVIRLRFFEKLTWEQIADRLQFTPKGVSLQKDRAIEQLAHMYEELEKWK